MTVLRVDVFGTAMPWPTMVVTIVSPFGIVKVALPAESSATSHFVRISDERGQSRRGCSSLRADNWLRALQTA
jgi:hypothetical protein